MIKRYLSVCFTLLLFYLISTPLTAQIAKKGSSPSGKVTIDKITYKIKDGSAYVYDTDKDIEEAIIRSYVPFEGKEYPVTRVKITPGFSDKTPFSRREKLKKVSIPNTVTKLDKFTFAWSNNLEELIVPDAPMEIVGTRNSKGTFSNTSSATFQGCYSIKTVRCQNGSYPSYILPYLEGNCPFYLASRTIPVSPTIISNASAEVAVSQPTLPKRPSSDVDTDIPSSSTANDKTFAVIIANENYQEETKVDYAQNDGEMFKEYCHKALGLPEENVHIRAE